MMKMRTFILLSMVGAMLFLQPVEGSSRNRKKKKQVETETKQVETNAYDSLLKKAEVSVGMMRLLTVGNDYYFEIADSLMGRDLLIVNKVTKVPGVLNDAGLNKGMEYDNKLIRFHRDEQMNKVWVTTYDPRVSVPEGDAIAQSVKDNYREAIIEYFPIEAYSNDSSAVVIKVNKVFDGSAKSFNDVYNSIALSMASFKRDLSKIESIKVFPENIVVRAWMTASVADGGVDVPLTVETTTNIVLLPKEPMVPRFADARVGFFSSEHVYFNDAQHEVERREFVHRWRLEPKPEDVERYKRGELVEPKKPIVFYIDNNFPEPWVKYVYAGVEDWNEAFEAIGFKNAIQARPFPTDDPEFDPDNIKYSCVRYAPTWMANSMGPSWTDPRTGEIINASVYTYHNIVSILYSWKFLQTATADPDVRVKNFSEEIMGEAIQYVIAHEIGHCLGFMHNMGASSAMPVEKLRDPEFTQKYGITPTIMDYARFNYVAQPGDKERGVRLKPLDLGVYDYFLVKWNYTPLLDAKTPEEEEKILNQWVAEKAGDPMYRYGKQQIYVLLDPSALTEDLGDDAMKAAAYGIKNLKYILPNLNTWFDDVDKDYTHRASLYNELIQQYVRYVNHVFVNVGGIYLTERYVGDPLPSYQSVPKEKQMRAVQFLMDQVRDIDWLEDKELVQNLPLMGSPASDIQTEIIDKIMASVSKLALSASKSDDPYTPEECLNDVYDFVWATTLKGGKTDVTDRKLQNAFVKSLISKSKTSGNGGMITLGVTDQFPVIEAPKYVNQTSIKNFGTNEWNSQEQVNGDVNGFEFLVAVNYATSPSIAHIYYGLLLKTKALLEKNVNHASMETRNHYRLLLHQIEKALK